MPHKLEHLREEIDALIGPLESILAEIPVNGATFWARNSLTVAKDEIEGLRDDIDNFEEDPPDPEPEDDEPEPDDIDEDEEEEEDELEG